MRSRIRKALNVRANGPWIIASALLVALMVAPFAGAFGEGNNVRGGARNPSSDARRAYTKETEIIANVSTYGTRQSNKSNNGGGAVYGCRSAAGGTAEGQRALRARQQPGRRPRVRVQRQRRHRGRRHHRSGRRRRRSRRPPPAWPPA